MLEIGCASLSLLELKAHLSEHMNLKASTRYYFLFPGKELYNALVENGSLV
jgi:hypothetical protein